MIGSRSMMGQLALKVTSTPWLYSKIAFCKSRPSSEWCCSAFTTTGVHGHGGEGISRHSWKRQVKLLKTRKRLICYRMSRSGWPVVEYARVGNGFPESPQASDFASMDFSTSYWVQGSKLGAMAFSNGQSTFDFRVVANM